MIDIHCHLLPGIDDGVKTMDESMQILHRAEAAGITDIILTPHYIWGTVYNADNAKKWQLFQELRTRVQTEGLKINLYLGNEIYIDERLLEMLGGYTGEDANENMIYQVSTLNSQKYVLVELPVQSEDKTAQRTLFKLVQKGFVPVIAHPERYFYVQENEHYMDEFLQMGCVLQGDYLALTGKYGKAAEKTLKKLLLAGKIFCLASDMHRVGDYKLGETRKKIMKLLKNTAKVDELLYSNPSQVLTSISR